MKVKISLFTFTLLIIIFNSCRKEENTTSQFRITEWKTYQDNNMIEYTRLKYVGDLLSEINSEGQDLKMEIEYPSGDSVIIIVYKHIIDNATWTPYSKSVSQINFGKIIQSIGSFYNPYEDKWYLDWKNEFDYMDSLLVEELYYLYQAGNWVQSLQDNYLYSSGKMTGFLRKYYSSSSGGWEMVSEKQYLFANDDLYQVLVNHYENDEIALIETDSYSYQNDLISAINVTRNEIGVDWPETLFSFDYDSFGNMTGRSVSTNSSGFRTDYKYERGKGNFEQLFNNSFAIEPNTTLPWSFFSVTGK